MEGPTTQQTTSPRVFSRSTGHSLSPAEVGKSGMLSASTPLLAHCEFGTELCKDCPVFIRLLMSIFIPFYLCIYMRGCRAVCVDVGGQARELVLYYRGVPRIEVGLSGWAVSTCPCPPSISSRVVCSGVAGLLYAHVPSVSSYGL